MYFPYVFGRASELLAIRSSSKNYLSSGLVVPIIEPVVAKPAALIRAIEEVGNRAQKAIVITNPSQGELKGGPPPTWVTSIDGALATHPTLIPGFLCRPGVTHSAVLSFLAKYGQRDTALLYLNSGLPDAAFNSLAAIPHVAYHIALQGKVLSSQLALLPHAKKVHVFDHFNKQPRNADYGGEELFTDRHRSFNEHGAGFGDYTITGPEVQLGGGPPGAVAVHITYKKATDGNLWVQHFVSDDTDVNIGTTGEKFLQAISKFASQYRSRVAEFGANAAVNDYMKDHNGSHFPGLPKNKERQIQHHIARIHDFLLTGN
ncbi:sce7725 family protein [Janthinobacterium sp. JC611]|uniref:sce7725 family protein n=1 Tax=Janthinobacterium sp. JC611 TaxID=2816201 RepID=UPI001BFEC9F3|nr:sce7725 family protein [Janthinobacterium sp. JC611]